MRSKACEEISVASLTCVYERLFARKGTRDIVKLFSSLLGDPPIVPAGMTWKSAPNFRVLAPYSEFWRDLVFEAPNAVINPSEMKEAIIACEESGRINFTALLTADVAERVSAVARMGLSKLRDIARVREVARRAAAKARFGT